MIVVIFFFCERSVHLIKMMVYAVGDCVSFFFIFIIIVYAFVWKSFYFRIMNCVTSKALKAFFLYSSIKHKVQYNATTKTVNFRKLMQTAKQLNNKKRLSRGEKTGSQSSCIKNEHKNVCNIHYACKGLCNSTCLSN